MFLNMGTSSILDTLTTAMIEGYCSALYALIHYKDIENIFLIVVIIFWDSFQMWELQREGNTTSYFPVVIWVDVVCQRSFSFLADSVFSILERIEWLLFTLQKPKKVEEKLHLWIFPAWAAAPYFRGILVYVSRDILVYVSRGRH